MQIERINVVSQVLEYLKHNINTGIWKPGEKIDSELKLVEKLHVSRASVKSAIQQLAALGVLESFQGKGTYIKQVPFQEIQNRLESISKHTSMRKLIEFRIIVEVGACRQAAAQISDDMIDELANCLEGMKRNKSELNKPQFVEYDIKFHRTLLMATQNEIIVKSVDVVQDEIQRQGLAYATLEVEEKAIMYHQRILECVRAHDGNGVAKAMLEHLRTTFEDAQTR